MVDRDAGWGKLDKQERVDQCPVETVTQQVLPLEWEGMSFVTKMRSSGSLAVWLSFGLVALLAFEMALQHHFQTR